MCAPFQRQSVGNSGTVLPRGLRLASVASVAVRSTIAGRELQTKVWIVARPLLLDLFFFPSQIANQIANPVAGCGVYLCDERACNVLRCSRLSVVRYQMRPVLRVTARLRVQSCALYGFPVLKCLAILRRIWRVLFHARSSQNNHFLDH